MKKLCSILCLLLIGVTAYGQARLTSAEIDSANDLFDVGGGTKFGNIDNPTHVKENMWDNNTETKATWTDGPVGIEALVGVVDMPKRYVATRYTLTMPGDATYRNWTNWTFEGSNDSTDGTNGSWETIGTFDGTAINSEWQTFRVFSWRSDTYRSDFTATNGYNGFRMRVTDPITTTTNSIPHLSEIEIFGYEYVQVTNAAAASQVQVGGVDVVLQGGPLFITGGATVTNNLFDNSDWWTPAEITTELWTDPSDTASFECSVAGIVYTLDDKSGNGRDAIQPNVSERPEAWRSHINYLNVIRYTDGSDMSMEVTNFPVPASGNFTIFQITRVTELDIFDAGLFSMDAATADWQFQNGVTASTPFNGRLVSTGLGASNGNASPAMGDGPSIYHVEFDFDGNAIRCYVDGGLRYTTTYTTKVGTNQMLRIMANRNTFGTVGGDTAETILIEGTDTNTINKIVGYSAWKYDFVDNLDSGHPYKSERPLK